MKRRLDVVGMQPDVVRFHSADVPILAADLVEAVGGVAFDDEIDRAEVVGHP
jgi:hypothetical protein